jgi:hypothetical protein
MGLGDKAAALALSERAMAANPIEKDALLNLPHCISSMVAFTRAGSCIAVEARKKNRESIVRR